MKLEKGGKRDPVVLEPNGLQLAISDAAPDIIRSIIEQAKKGSCTHAKFLFEFAGLECAPSGPAIEADESLASLFMRELKEMQTSDAEPGVEG